MLRDLSKLKPVKENNTAVLISCKKCGFNLHTSTNSGWCDLCLKQEIENNIEKHDRPLLIPMILKNKNGGKEE